MILGVQTHRSIVQWSAPASPGRRGRSLGYRIRPLPSVSMNAGSKLPCFPSITAFSAAPYVESMTCDAC